MFGELINILIV